MGLRDELTNTAASLFEWRDSLPTFDGDEYFRGQVELITYATLNRVFEDPDVIKEEVAEAIRLGILKLAEKYGTVVG